MPGLMLTCRDCQTSLKMKRDFKVTPNVHSSILSMILPYSMCYRFIPPYIVELYIGWSMKRTVQNFKFVTKYNRKLIRLMERLSNVLFSYQDSR